MYPLFETIRISMGAPKNLFWHNHRMNGARRDFFGEDSVWDLNDLVHCPDDLAKHEVKCRFMYDRSSWQADFSIYEPRNITKLILVSANDLNYKHKFTDRSRLDALKTTYAPGMEEDVLIAIDDCITDSSFANVIFFTGTEWHTPDTPLLNGTQRMECLRQNLISEKKIRIADITRYVSVKLINAMLPPGDSDCGIPVNCIYRSLG